MNNNLAEVLKRYATQPHKKLQEFLQARDKEYIISILLDILTEYFNDKNSSTVRESVIVSLSGFEPRKQKIGYNGYKTDSVSGEVEHCEAKPANINTNNKKVKKLNGRANFTDYTWERFEKNKCDNPLMIVGGFIDGRLIYIFKFKFNSAREFLERLEKQLQKRFPKGDMEGNYLRSASFGFKYYKECEDLEIDVFVDKQELSNFKPLYNKRCVYVFRKELVTMSKNFIYKNKLITEDTLIELKKIPSGVVDCGVTSPPYNKQEKNKGWLVNKVVYSQYKDALPEDTYQNNQIDVLNELYRVIKPGGSFFYNHKIRWVEGEMFHPMDWLRKTQWAIRQEIIWDRTLAGNIRGWRFWQVEERVYWLYKPIDKNKKGVELASKDAKNDIYLAKRTRESQSTPCPISFVVACAGYYVFTIRGCKGISHRSVCR